MIRSDNFPQIRLQQFFKSIARNALAAYLLILLCVAHLDCSSRKSEEGKETKKVGAVHTEFAAVDALKVGGSHGETVPHFKDFHDVLHLLNGFIRKGEYEPIGMLFPYLKQRLETLVAEEGKLATPENGYKLYLDNLYWQTQEFIFTHDEGSYNQLRSAFKKMHDAYDDVKRHRPGGALPVKE